MKNITAIGKFRKKEDLLITFKELSEIPLNKTIQIVDSIHGAIESTRITSNTDSLMFTVSMKKGYKWLNHNHDCFEIILLYKGKLKNITKDINIQKAETMLFRPYESHYVLAEEDSKFYVEFKKPKSK